MKFTFITKLIFVLVFPVSVYILYNQFIRDVSIDKPDNDIIQSGDRTITLGLSGGGSVDVDNFLNLPEVIQSQDNENEYYLGKVFEVVDPNVRTASYIITFDAETKYFNIALLSKPLGESRQVMEKYLKELLGVNESQMCKLNYTVSVPGYVDENASSIDYRFSFCPGSVEL